MSPSSRRTVTLEAMQRAFSTILADGCSRARSGIVPIVARPSHVQHDPFVADSRLSPSPPANATTLTLPSSFQLEEKRPSRGTPPWPD